MLPLTLKQLGCSCLAFLCSQGLEEMLKCGFILQESCPSAWHRPPFFTSEVIHRFRPSLYSILGCFCLLCPPCLYLHLHSFLPPPCFSALRNIQLILCPAALPHHLAQPLSPLPLDTDLTLTKWSRPLLHQCPSLVLPTPVVAQP